MEASPVNHYAECFSGKVQSAREAEEHLSTLKKGLGDIVLWKDPSKLNQIQITFISFEIGEVGNKFKYKTLYCLADEVKTLGGLRALQKFISERLITLVVFDNDWTLTKYHTYHECGVIQKRFNGWPKDYTQMLRFPEVVDVLQAIDKLPNTRIAIATGSDTAAHAQGILKAVFKNEWQRVVPPSFLIYGKHKAKALSEILSNMTFCMDLAAVAADGQLSLNSKVGPIGLARVLFVNDHKIENEIVTKAMGGLVNVIGVDDRSNAYLLELNRTLNLGLTLQLATHPAGFNALPPKPKARIRYQSPEEKTSASVVARESRETNGAGPSTETMQVEPSPPSSAGPGSSPGSFP